MTDETQLRGTASGAGRMPSDLLPATLNATHEGRNPGMPLTPRTVRGPRGQPVGRRAPRRDARRAARSRRSGRRPGWSTPSADRPHDALRRRHRRAGCAGSAPRRASRLRRTSSRGWASTTVRAHDRRGLRLSDHGAARRARARGHRHSGRLGGDRLSGRADAASSCGSRKSATPSAEGAPRSTSSSRASMC